MINYEDFRTIVIEDLKRDIGGNIQQNNSIKADVNDSEFIVAGPGSGKTTVMVLKVLKYIFVDDIKPEEIMVTTFTRKAANELLSRILSWGMKIRDHIIGRVLITEREDLNKLFNIDLNKITIGTLDSVSEELMRNYREAGTKQPIIIEEFIAKNAMLQLALLKDDRVNNRSLKSYLESFQKTEVLSDSQMADTLLKFKDRLFYDYVEDWDKLIDNSKGSKIALECINDYISGLESRNMLDFAMLEFKFLEFLDNGKLDSFLKTVKVLLIDEYQDTNYLQEKIYFEIAKHAVKNGGNITVVGDDDQALYRFRGATVDLFTDYKKRVLRYLDLEVTEINLKHNYRSSENIVNLCNDFVDLDAKYQDARVENKDSIIYAKNTNKENIPVLGMFRSSPKRLARDLSRLIKKLLKGGTVKLSAKRVLTKESRKRALSEDIEIKLNSPQLERDMAKEKGKIELSLGDDPSPSDITFLSYSPKEKINGNYMLPHYLKKDLNKFDIDVFNLRGQDLQSVHDIGVFCGLILECLDPGGEIQKKNNKISQLAKNNMKKWRKSAINYMDKNPEPREPVSLREFVDSWANRKSLNLDSWPSTVNILDLVYKVVMWIPSLHDDTKDFVYFETVVNTISQTSFFNEYNGVIYFYDGDLEFNSINEVIENIFAPIARGDVSVDENLLGDYPDSCVNIMSIHQSKGLEFPFVIVDVGSRFRTNKANTNSLRFPKAENSVRSMEDCIREYSNLDLSSRGFVDRNFDDLTRLYFVAFSRAEEVLLLVGLESNIDGYGEDGMSIPNVALGWNRQEEYIGFDEIYLI